MLRIMLVDDEQVVRRGLEMILSKSGRDYTVVASCGDGLDALETLAKVCADVVVTDIRMPQMDGLALVNSLHNANANLPCIILSGYSDFEYARSALRFGATDYLLKPVDPEELFGCLDKIAAKSPGKGSFLDSECPEEGHIVRNAKKIIENEYNGDLNVADIARRLYVHPNYLSRLFKRETGVNVTDYWLQIRLDKAKELLRDSPNLKIYEIAQYIGYNNSIFFNKVFKRIVGKTPKEYRNHPE